MAMSAMDSAALRPLRGNKPPAATDLEVGEAPAASMPRRCRSGAATMVRERGSQRDVRRRGQDKGPGLWLKLRAAEWFEFSELKQCIP